MAEPARQIATGDRLWRGAALAVLGGGIGVALWHDPALLERREVTLPLALAFAALWMVPHLRARRAAARSADAAVQPIRDPGADRAAIDLTLGGVAGLLSGALFLSFAGSAALLTQGPQAVDWAFDQLETMGLWAAIAAALVAVVFWRLISLAVMGAIRTSRFLMGFVMGLFLWLPFHGAFQAGLANLGFELPGLMTPESGANG